MNRQTKVSLLKKERELLYQILPKDTKGEIELKLLCDTVSQWVTDWNNKINHHHINRINNPKDLKIYLKSILQIEAKEENIEKVRSDKKRLCLSKRNYKQRFESNITK
jgi:hypothetical protein